MKVTQKLLRNMIKMLINLSIIALVLSWTLPWIIEFSSGIDLWYTRINLSVLEEESFAYIFDYILYAELAYWGAFICSLVLSVAIAIKNTSKRISNYLMMGGIPHLVFSSIALFFSVWTVVKLRGIEETSYKMGFNYGPMLMAIPLFVVSLIFVILVVPRTIKSIQRTRDVTEDKDTTIYDEKEAIEETYFDCPVCGEKHNDTLLTCNSCGANLSKKCPQCDMLVNIHITRCPQCGYQGQKRELTPDGVKSY